MRFTFKLLQNVQFWLFWQDFKNSHRSAMIDISKSFILMMDTYSQIYIKSNFQDPTFWAGKCRKLLIFKAADFASEIDKNAFWRSFCSWKTPISWLVTIKWPLQTPMLVVVLMMINPNFFDVEISNFEALSMDSLWISSLFQMQAFESFCVLPARAERLQTGLRPKTASFEAFCFNYLLVKTTSFWSNFNVWLPFLKHFHRSI